MQLLKTLLSLILLSPMKVDAGAPPNAVELPDDADLVPTEVEGEKFTGEAAPWPVWAEDRLGYWPLHDRGGGMSEYDGPGDQGMLGVLARIELNEEDGEKLGKGLPANPLRPKAS